MSNAERIEIARRTLERYHWLKDSESLSIRDVETAIVDLITDIRHLCGDGAYGYSFDEVLRISEMHYEAEVSEEA